jgi:hypothetical protein
MLTELAIRLDRSRAVAVMGAALFGLATRLARPNLAAASHDPCISAGKPHCNCCGSSASCCATFCYPADPGVCSGPTHCWMESKWIPGDCYEFWRCCDYRQSNDDQSPSWPCYCASYEYTLC